MAPAKIEFDYPQPAGGSVHICWVTKIKALAAVKKRHPSKRDRFNNILPTIAKGADTMDYIQMGRRGVGANVCKLFAILGLLSPAAMSRLNSACFVHLVGDDAAKVVCFAFQMRPACTKTVHLCLHFLYEINCEVVD
jgi:hypothetical protein